MKKLTAILVSLVLAVSLLVGVGVMAGAENTDGIVQSSLNLAENVTVYVEVAIAAPTDGAYAKITTPDGKVDNQLLSDAAKNGDNYVFTAEVAVKDLAGDVTVEILNADGTTLVEAEKTSAVAYCDQYLETTPDGEFAALVGALKAYAGAALTYFSDDIIAEGATAPDLSAVADMKLQGELPAGITHKSVTLLLENETVIRHYFILEAGKLIENYKFFVDKNANGACNADEKLAAKAKTNADGSVVYYVDIEGITPNELDEVYTLGVTGTDGKTYTCAYGALTYLKRVATAEASDDMKALATALVNYNAEAGKLVGTVTFDANGGSAVANQTYEYGVNTPLVAPTSNGELTFLGWYDASGALVTEIAAKATGDIALTAKWAPADTFSSYKADVPGGALYDGYCDSHADGEDEDAFCDKCGFCISGCGMSGTSGSCTVCGKSASATTSIGVFNLYQNYGNKGKYNHGYAINSKRDGIDGVELNYSSIETNNRNQQVLKAGTVASGFTKGYTQLVYSFTLAKAGDKVANIYARTRNAAGSEVVVFTCGSKGEISVFGQSTGVSLDSTVRTYDVALDYTSLNADGTGPITVRFFVDGVLKSVITSSLPSSITTFTKNSSTVDMRYNSTGSIWIGSVDISFNSPGNVIYYPVEATVADSAPETYTYGEATALPETATREGYVFDGWYADEALTQPIDAIPANAVGGFNLYAKWIEAPEAA